jgi:hypothetical protein
MGEVSLCVTALLYNPPERRSLLRPIALLGGAGRQMPCSGCREGARVAAHGIARDGLGERLMRMGEAMIAARANRTLPRKRTVARSRRSSAPRRSRYLSGLGEMHPARMYFRRAMYRKGSLSLASSVAARAPRAAMPQRRRAA